MLLAVSSSFLFVWLTFGVEFLSGAAPYWQSQVDDITQYIAGFNLYFIAPWQIPLLGFDGFNYPQGTRVTFVDAIPLFSLFLKVFVPASWAPFNPFGVWVGLCFIGQGVGAWWILKELGVRSLFALIALMALFLIFPALMVRLGHISLMSHWIILFSVALYFKSCNENKLAAMAWSALLLSAFYVNIYLFVMASAIMLAAFLNARRNLKWRDFGLFFMPYAFIFSSLFIMILPLPLSEVAAEGGFGYYSMNILAPFMGGKWISFTAGQGSGQYEGFNYLGLGVLSGLVYLLLRYQNFLVSAMHRHWPLFCILLICVFYSLSNHIFFGANEVAIIKYPDFLAPVTSQFRASGRFFWIVGYFVVIYVVVGLYRNMNHKSFIFATIAVVALQVGDVNGIYQSMRSGMTRTASQPLDSSLWDKQLESNVKVLYFYPKFKCGSKPLETLMPVMQYAGQKGLKLNTGYISRYSPNCSDVKNEIANSDPKRSAYIFARSDYVDANSVRSLFPISMNMRCEVVQFAYVCQGSILE